MHGSYISVVVPVYREQACIHDFLTHIGHVFSGTGYEIIIVDGSPDHETLAAVHDTDIKAVPSAPGRSRQMNQGACVAQGDILLFVHVDTYMPDHAPDLILQAMKDKKNVGGAFSLGIDSRDPLLRLIACVANLRTGWTRVPYGDQAIFMRTEYFQKIGMFPDIPLMEDLELMHRIKRRGWRVVILPQRVLTSPRRWLQEGKLKCTLRNWALRILYHCGVPAEKLAGYYKVGHKSKEL